MNPHKDKRLDSEIVPHGFDIARYNSQEVAAVARFILDNDGANIESAAGITVRKAGVMSESKEDEYYIANVSFGKDSLAMVYLLITKGYPLDEVVFYDTGAEFDCIYRERDKLIPTLESLGITYTELKPKEPFFYTMFARHVKGKTNPDHNGYGWCGGTCRWGTSAKIQALDRYSKARDAITYVGIAADEHKRIAKAREEWKRLPLVELNMTEADCLSLCRRMGHNWLEDGTPLYDVLDRVSCWCCRNKNMKELRAIHKHLPRYWNRLLSLEECLGQMKSKPLSEVVSE